MGAVLNKKFLDISNLYPQALESFIFAILIFERFVELENYFAQMPTFGALKNSTNLIISKTPLISVIDCRIPMNS